MLRQRSILCLIVLLLALRGLDAASFRRGDVDGNATADMSDAIRILTFLFLGGGAPACLDAADTNDSGKVDVSDASFLLSYLFLGGKAPADPFRACGADPTQDSLDCSESPTCEEPTPPDTVPVISRLAPDANQVARPQGADVSVVRLGFGFSHADSSITDIEITTVPPEGEVERIETSAAAFGIEGASGKAFYQAAFYSTSPLGEYEYRIRLIDSEGHEAQASTRVTLVKSGTPRVALSSISPAAGAAGDVVTLSGVGLDASSLEATHVSFAGTRAEIEKVSSGRISCIVPRGALTGPVLVSNARGVALSAGNFTVRASIAIASSGKETLLPLEKRQLRAEATGLANKLARWYVNGTAGGSATLGTVDKAGLYTAPAVPPVEGAVTIAAISAEDDSLRAEVRVGLGPVPPVVGAGIINGRTGGRVESVAGSAAVDIQPGALRTDLKVTRVESRFIDTSDAIPGLPAKSIPLVLVETEASGKPALSGGAIGVTALLPFWNPPKTELLVLTFNGKTFVDTGARATTGPTGTTAHWGIDAFGSYVIARDPAVIRIVPPELFPNPEVDDLSVPVSPEGIEEGMTLPVLVRGKNFWQSFTRVRAADPTLRPDLEIGSVLVNPQGTELGFTVRIRPMPALRAGRTQPVAFRIERLSSSNQITGQIDTDPNDFVIRGLSELIVAPDLQGHVYTIDGLRVDRLVNDSHRFSTIVVEPGAVLGIGTMVGNVFTDDGMSRDLSTLDAFEASFGLLSWVADRGLDRASVRIFQPENDLIWLEATGPIEIDGTVAFGGMRGGENAALDHPSGPGLARLGGVASGSLSGGMGGDGGVTVSGATANGHSAGNGITERGVGHGAHGIADAQASVAGFGARFDPQVIEIDGFVEEAVAAFNPFSPPKDLIEAALRIGKLALAAADLGTTATINHSQPENIVAGAGGHGGRRASGQSRHMTDDASILPGSGGGGGGGGGSTSHSETLFGVTLLSEAAKGGAGAGGGGSAGSLRMTTSSLFRIGRSGRLDGSGGRGGFGEPHQWVGSPGGGGGGGSGGIAKLQGARLLNQGDVDISGGERAGAIVAQSSSPAPSGGNGRVQALNGEARGGFIYYGCRCPYLDVASPTVDLCWPTGRKRAEIQFTFLSGIRGIGSATHVVWLPFLPPIRSGLLILDDHKRVWLTSLPDFLAPNPEPSFSTLLAELVASPPMSGFVPTDIAQSPNPPYHHFISGVRGSLRDRIATSEVLEYDESFQYVATVFSRETAEILNGAQMLGHLSDIDFLSDGRLVGMMAARHPIETGIHAIDVLSGVSTPLLDLPDFEPTILRSMSVVRGSEDQFITSLGTTGPAPGVRYYDLSGQVSHAAMVVETISSPGEPGLLRLDGGLPGSNAPRVVFDGLEVPDPRYEPSTFDAPAIGSFAAPASSSTGLESLVFGGPRVSVYCQGAERASSSALWKVSDVSPPIAAPAPPADGLGQIASAAMLDEGFNTLWIETNVGGTTHELLRRPVLYIKNANIYAPRGD